VIAIFAMIYMVYKGYNDDRYIVQAFDVPQTFDANGISGNVLARKIQDEVSDFKKEHEVFKKDSIQLDANAAPDLQVALMGVGLSVNSITYHIKNLFGKDNKIITGELIDLNDQLELTVRMSGFEPTVHRVSYIENSTIAYDSLLQLGAQAIIKNTDPYRMVSYYIDEGQSAKALRMINWLINAERDVEWAYMAWGQLLQTQDERKEANEKYKKAIEIKPDFLAAYKFMAWNNFWQTDFEAAKKDFESVLKIDPEDFNAINGIGQCYRRMGNHKEAVAIFEKIIEKNPETIWGYSTAAGILQHGLKDTVAAMAMLQRGAANAKDGVQKYSTLANYYSSAGKQDSVLFYFEKILEIRPNNSRTLIQLINHYYSLKDYEKSKYYARRLIATNPQRGYDAYYHKLSAYNMKAMIHYEEEQFDSALVHVKKSIDMDPSIAAPYTTLAEIYGMQGQMEPFYKNLQIGIDKGFPLEDLLKLEPYNRFLNRSRMKTIIEKYYKDRDAVVPKDIAEARD